MAAVMIHSDFRVILEILVILEEEEICHCFHIFPFYFP